MFVQRLSTRFKSTTPPTDTDTDMPADKTRSTEDGFSLVELLSAAFILVIGILAVLGLFTSALKTTAANNERVGASNLARELVEAARGVAYESLNDAEVEAAIQALPNMGGGDPWVVVRRNVRYEIEARACVYDDPTDGTDPARPVCAGNPTSATADKNGDDFRRVTFDISWKDHNGGAGKMTQTTMIVNPSGGLGPRIITITADTPVITNPATQQATFTVTSALADLLNWAADDGRSSGQYVGPAKTWKIVWNLGVLGASGSVVDGTYRVNAQATDNNGIAGDTKVATVKIDRTIPLALKAQGGWNRRLGLIEMMWDPTTERDVIGYRVYYAGADKVRGGGDDVLVCPSGGGYLELRQISCTYPKNLTKAEVYYVVALDEQGAREGNPSVGVTAEPTSSMPNPPLVQGSRENGAPRLDWTPPSFGPTPYLYRIYRGGTGLADRIGWVPASSTNFVDTSSSPGGTYYVTTVDANFNESLPSPGVSP